MKEKRRVVPRLCAKRLQNVDWAMYRTSHHRIATILKSEIAQTRYPRGDVHSHSPVWLMREKRRVMPRLWAKRFQNADWGM